MADLQETWTDKRLKELTKLWNRGVTITEIGKKLGVSRNAVAGKASRLGLPKRESPINQAKAKANKAAKKMVSKAEMPEPTLDRTRLPLRLELRGLKWSRNSCCWPSGDPKHSGFSLCGERVAPGKPYCVAHCEEAYTNLRENR